MLILLSFVLATQIKLEESTPGLRDSLAAAHATNAARASQGSGIYELAYQYDAMSKRAEAEVSEKWSGDDFEISAKLDDLEGVLFAGAPARPIRQQALPMYVLLYAGKKMYCYSTNEKVVKVFDRSTEEDRQQMLNVSPRMSWFRCYGPDFGSGRPWIDLVDMKMPAGVNQVRSGKLEKQGDRILFIRTDLAGTLTVDFSIANDLNVIGFKYQGMGGRLGSENREGSFVWKKTGKDTAYLSDLKVIKFVGSSEKPDSEYRLTTRKFSLETPAKDYFTERAFFARLPENVLVIDHSRSAKGRQYLINKKATSSKAVDQSFVDSIKSGSLLNKKP